MSHWVAVPNGIIICEPPYATLVSYILLLLLLDLNFGRLVVDVSLLVYAF